ncbi:hypothetical protein GF389_03580 [Candidatus Dojkabacteria bacterium]|nr:hypothetical protein [Candidatus Dojkabacteria bacterium]
MSNFKKISDLQYALDSMRDSDKEEAFLDMQEAIKMIGDYVIEKWEEEDN